MFIGILFVLAIAIFGFLFLNFDIPNINDLIFWSLLAIVVESFLVMLPKIKVGVSVGYAINIAAIIAGGPLIGTISSCLGFLFRVPKVPSRGHIHLFNTPIYKTIYNVSQGTITSAILGLVYVYTNGKVGEFSLVPTIIIVILGGITNSIMISILVSLMTDEPIISIWTSNIKGIFPNTIAVGAMGIIIALAYISYGYGAVVLFLGPLLILLNSYKLNIDTTSVYFSTIKAFNSVMEAKDPYTSGHSTRVEKYAVKLAESYGLSTKQIENIRNASILHDIGKVGIHDNILNKPCKLTIEEYEEIKKHPTIGSGIISNLDALNKISEIIKYHHERYDGKGYPDGVAGDNIPIESCIIAIADSYDAMTSDRPYRRALNEEEAIEEIRINIGLQFHPELAKEFIKILRSEQDPSPESI